MSVALGSEYCERDNGMHNNILPVYSLYHVDCELIRGNVELTLYGRGLPES